MLIQYCDQCGVRIPEKDLTEGRASHSGERLLCAKCLAVSPAPPPAAKASGLLLPRSGRLTATARGTPSKGQTRRMAKEPAPETEKKSPVALIALAGVAITVVGLVLYLSSGGKTPA